MKTKAAVLVETGKPLEIIELEIPALKPGQTIIQVLVSGVCHTQVLEARGYKGKDPFLPHCMGHEGVGRVLEIGSEVSRVKVGDRVALSWIKASGKDVPGSVYSDGKRSVNAGAITTFMTHAVISENRLTPIPDELPNRQAALLGCAVPTGFGVLFNTAGAQSGKSVAVFGAGGIGLCAVIAAGAAECNPVIAVDVLPNKLELARGQGATHTINSTNEDPVKRITEIVKGGVDIAIEATGRPQVMAQALQSVRQQGGVAAVVGNARADEMLQFDPKQLNMGKQLRGSWGGDNVPDRDFPRYIQMLLSGKINLDALVSRTYSLTQINQALDELAEGKAARPIIDLSL